MKNFWKFLASRLLEWSLVAICGLGIVSSVILYKYIKTIQHDKAVRESVLVADNTKGLISAVIRSRGYDLMRWGVRFGGPRGFLKEEFEADVELYRQARKDVLGVMFIEPTEYRYVLVAPAENVLVSQMFLGRTVAELEVPGSVPRMDAIHMTLESRLPVCTTDKKLWREGIGFVCYYAVFASMKHEPVGIIALIMDSAEFFSLFIPENIRKFYDITISSLTDNKEVYRNSSESPEKALASTTLNTLSFSWKIDVRPMTLDKYTLYGLIPEIYFAVLITLVVIFSGALFAAIGRIRYIEKYLHKKIDSAIVGLNSEVLSLGTMASTEDARTRLNSVISTLESLTYQKEGRTYRIFDTTQP